MLSNSVVSFYDNFSLIFKGSAEKTTTGIENWSPSTTQLLTDTSSCENPSKYPHEPDVAKNYSLWQTFCCWQHVSIFIRFHILVSESEAEKSSQTDDENKF